MRLLAKITKIAFLLLITFAVIWPTNQALGAKYTWKFIMMFPGSMENKYSKSFADKISQKTNGEVEIKLYNRGALGTAKQESELLTTGAVQLAIIDPGFAATTIKEYEIWNLFYIWPQNLDKVDALAQNRDAKWFQLLKEITANYNTELIRVMPCGFTVISSNHPLRTFEDFMGFKIRVMPSLLLVEQYKSLGAVPLTLPFGELYGALQLNVVDGQDNPYWVIDFAKFYEVQKYITCSNHFMGPMIIGANGKWYNKLPDRLKNIIIETEQECFDQYLLDRDEYNNEARSKIEKANPSMVFIDLPVQEVEKMKRAILPVRKEFVKLTGNRGKLLFDYFLEAVEKLEKK